MIVQLTGTLADVEVDKCVLDVAGVGYELGISYSTRAQLPPLGTAGVKLYVRMRVKDETPVLFGFASKEERTVFDKLCSVSSVGPKLALAVLSSLSPSQLAETVATKDQARLVAVPGVGKKTASRLLLELEGLFAKDPELRSMAQTAALDFDRETPAAASFISEATEALLSMGFTPQEAELSLADYDKNGVDSVEKALQYALKRMGGGR
jgi:Holliday junction DNA helicase RuvA